MVQRQVSATLRTVRASRSTSLGSLTANRPPPIEYTSDIKLTAAGEAASANWSFGTRRGGTSAGDRVFLLHQGTDRGFVTSGH